ncbi:MAG: CBS domain-containing protein [Chloroflexi bacterium]|nr:CBS domain-containing protein [Chloroflexota bacterium]
MSPRAAARLDSIGFTQVFDYAAGKADWTSSGLPTEGTAAGQPRAGDIAQRDIPTCGLANRLGDARGKTQDADQNVCIVVDDHGVVLGRLRGDALGEDPGATVESVMEDGPTTIRADASLQEITERMRKRGVGSILVTDPEGRLLGILYRDDAERVLAEKDKSEP